MSRDELAVLWQRRWRRAPPKGLSRRLLECNAAWLLQTEASGGLTAATRRRLDALARSVGSDIEEALDGKPSTTVILPAGPRKLRPGSRLVRQWHGRSHVVEVVDGGFTYERRRYASLTAIAQEITGAHWSGPRFFGLNALAPDKKAAWNGQKQHSDDKRPPAAAMREDECNV